MNINYRLFYLILFFGSCQYLSAQIKPTKLIVRGDDMGFSHAANEALVYCFQKGIQKTIEVIVPSPWFPEAVALLKQNPGVDVGVHLAITSEWDNLKWRPITYCPSLTDADGYFYPMIWPNQNYAGRSIKENPYKLSEIESEFRAQIELALKYIPNISHISGHMGCTQIDTAVEAMVNRLVQEYEIDIDLKELGVKGAGYIGNHRSFEEKIISFSKMLDKLMPGETYLFVDHPAYDSPETRAIHHIGYEWVAIDRQGVIDLWTNPEIMDKIKKLNIQLISYSDLKK